MKYQGEYICDWPQGGHLRYSPQLGVAAGRWLDRRGSRRCLAGERRRGGGGDSSYRQALCGDALRGGVMEGVWEGT